jgi:hypothetical protein
MKTFILFLLFLAFILGLSVIAITSYQSRQVECFRYERESAWLCKYKLHKSCKHR